MSPTPAVLFVCVSNRGKSVMAQALTRKMAGAAISASSAGTAAAIGGHVNELSAQVLAEVGAEVNDHHPRQLTDDLMRAADIIVVLGSSAEVAAPDGVVVEVWDTDEPSQRGIDGIDRMRVIRDDIAARVAGLTTRLTAS
ncbi:low molecular weight phosphatase family protein [Williamsia sp. 1135]|uniref:arsenate-mycothiol transferase ArsC n=1 Tax=Williamsia sp. 1135 TaxID=1889262 RepID=UPI000A10E30B|nr:low molecular weight phosphatase family protein [Williamsia sp. 1135]ORM33819.1 low molecular weight phosphatase family protein [Williamsia sp. 1135]